MNEKNKLFEGLKSDANITRTENLAKTYASSLDHVLDFFAMGGALRTRSEESVISLFSKAYATNPLLSLKALFYFRDIRQGQGERKTPRIILKYLAKNYPDAFNKNAHLIPEYGRWDDIFAGINQPKTKETVVNLIKEQLRLDTELLSTDKSVSMCAKWMPSGSGTMAKVYKNNLKELLGLSSEQYRKMLVPLRKRIRIVESLMCANKWTEIDYERVPSKASMIYGRAFRRHDEERYQAYLDAVEKGEKKIQTRALFPYEILRKAKTNPTDLETLNLMWKNLPNYCSEGGENSIVVCDTSNSMEGLPMDVSTSLAMYFSERNKGVWKNHFITFSHEPAFQQIVGSNLYEKYINLNNAQWNQNTDLVKVFELILRIATKNNAPKEDMVEKIYIVSDMEFDSATGYDVNTMEYSGQSYYYATPKKPEMTNFEKIKEMYETAGYKLPLLVFWNVDSRNDQSPVTISDSGVWLISGCSPTIFKNLMASTTTTAIDMMIEILNSERYSAITI